MQDETLFAKRIRIGRLYDVYGSLLTVRQQKIMEQYFYDDLSLGEIADAGGTSRQAVYDLLKRYTRHYVYWDRNKEEKKRREKEREQALGLFGRSRRKRRTKAVKKPRVASAPSLEKNLFDGSGHDPSVS